MSRRAAIGVALVLVAAGVAIYAWMREPPPVRCEVCVELDGRTACRRGTDAREDRARAVATLAACREFAREIEEVAACATAEPVRAACARDAD